MLSNYVVWCSFTSVSQYQVGSTKLHLKPCQLPVMVSEYQFLQNDNKYHFRISILLFLIKYIHHFHRSNSVLSPEDEDVQRARRKLSILNDKTLVESLDSVNLDTKEEDTATVILMSLPSLHLISYHTYACLNCT